MVITSENKSNLLIHYHSTQFRYALVYVVITAFVLIFLNVYSSQISQALFYNSKETSMIEKCQLTANEVASLEILNPANIKSAVTNMESLRVTRLVITDHNGIALFDSLTENGQLGKYTLFPEVCKALEGNNVFSWNYHDGAMSSRAAVPVYSYGTLTGCVYMMEYDTQQGGLIHSLQINTLIATVVLEIFVILFSLLFARIYTNRLRQIMSSIRIVREGDYSHTLKMRGNDELRILSDEFNDLIIRLQNSEEKRRQFVSDASHELKTPLASIKLLSDSILQNDMDMETIREFVQDIGNEADRLNRMSQKLLSLSRVESQSDSEYEIVYLAPTVKKVIRMLHEIARRSSISIQAELDGDCSILIIEDDLYQIIFNLVENGIKYNTAGGSLFINLQKNLEDVVLTVADTGVGIPAESLENIFERFYRVDKARSRKSGGSGLGLSIVKSLVERNGGTINVESVLNQGTTFTVRFPAFDTEEDNV